MNTEKQPPASTRHLANFFIAPKRQMRVALLAVAIGLCFFFAIFGFQLWLSSTLITSLSGFIPDNPTLSQMVADSVRLSWIVFLVSALCFTIAVTAITIIITHRIYGPVYAIRKHLAALAREEYGQRLHLRKHDEFKDLAQDLNALSERLEALSRSSTKL